MSGLLITIFILKHKLNIVDILVILKMLGLYLYTLKIGHKSCNMFSILNK